MKLYYVYVIVSASSLCPIFAQNAKSDDTSPSAALNEFALDFLAETCMHADETLNLALSPYTIWNVMAIINEGARRNTETQMEKTLGIPSDTATREQFRKLQQSLTENVLKKSDGISFEVLNAVFTRLEKKLDPNYQQMIQKLYNVEVASLDFDDSRNAANYINSKLSNATRGRLSNIVREDDLTDAQIFVTSALFFKGLWDSKFNRSDTKEKPFHNEHKKIIGTVEMMYNEGIFTLTKVLNDKAFAIELPYTGGKVSMIVILPLLTPLQTVANMLAEQPFDNILDALKVSAVMFANDPLKLHMPKFKISSDLNLNYVLYQMGIQDVFNSVAADLSGISPDPLFLSRVIHKAEIDVDEDGTTASSISAADLQNKISAAEIVLDRPFLYFIYDKETHSIIFMGKYSFPK